MARQRERSKIMKTLSLGVDIACLSMALAVLDDHGLETLASVSNDANGFAQLRHSLAARYPDLPACQIHVCLEPTGGYEEAFCLFACEQGWQVHLPNPKHVRDWAKGCGQRAKTDRIDARTLARYLDERRPPLWHPVDAPVSELDSLLERKRDLEQMLQQERNRHQLLARRPRIAGAVTGNVEQMLSSLEQALAQIEQAISEHLHQQPDLAEQARQLRTVPGVGAKNVLPLLITLCRFCALTEGAGSSKSLTAYAGLDPSTIQSGTSVRGARGISRLGNRRLRQQLYMGALGGTRGHNALRVFYERLVSGGKAKKTALVAAAHKILTWSWAVFRTQTDFDGNKYAVQPAAGS
jgi:transposase